MKVFITGGTGFIGRSLTAALFRRGWQVTALVRRPESAEAQALAQMGARLAQGDVTDRESMRAPMTGADIVIHNAAWYELGIGGNGARERMQAVNVDGTRHTLELAHELGAQRIVHVSSIVAIGETDDSLWDECATRRMPPPNIYEQSKAEAHAIALELARRGAPVIVAMPSCVFGPGDHANLGILQRLYVRGFSPMLTIGGGYRRSTVYVDDCAEGIALAAEKGRPGECYLLANGNHSYDEIYALWAETPGGFKPWGAMPRPLALLSGRTVEPVQRWFGLPNLLSYEATREAHRHYQYSGEKARRELGWQPGNPAEQWRQTLAEERRRAGKSQ